MSIDGSFDVYPGGSRWGSQELVAFHIHSTDNNAEHRYVITTCKGHTMIGTLPKTYSGHGNILHLLKAILDDVDLDKLGTDYSSIRKPEA